LIEPLDDGPRQNRKELITMSLGTPNRSSRQPNTRDSDPHQAVFAFAFAFSCAVAAWNLTHDPLLAVETFVVVMAVLRPAG